MEAVINPQCPMQGGCLITNILQEAWPEDQITEAVVLSPGEAILFLESAPRTRGFPIVGQEMLSLA